ncbi:MAG: LCP family protein [Oscillospiraceae bacterium]|nr:LCP family protein [Oscillospiraceae bacterium]MBQ7129566.1 LCP family protein [Oscillospiraceae bacterium]
MAKGGKYLAKKPVAKKKKKVLPIILLVLLLIVVICVGAGVWYYNHLLSMITRPDSVPVRPSVSVEATETETLPNETLAPETTVETSPEDTWPQIVSDENITNIMLVGQAAREGETHLISDTMILVSINREQKTLTLTSLMRDMCLVWPKYIDTNGKEHSGNNRINMAYNMGYHWTGNKQDSMDLLESIVQHNFGVPVDRTIEIDFQIFMDIVDLLGRVEIDISEEEYAYMLENANWMEDCGVHPGVNKLCGYHALCYARIRKIGHGDYDRTERQRKVITSLIGNLKEMNILQIHKLFTQILPKITTDMTNQEITNYAFEFIPMLKDLKIQSQRIPFEGNEISVVRDGDYMIAPANLKTTAKQLQESIGMTVAETTD